MKLETINLNCQ